MKNVYRIFIATMLVAFISLPSFAGGAISQSRAQSLHFDTLETLTSTPGQSFDAFLLEVGRTLRAYSDKSGFEACGMLAETSDKAGFGVVITTTGSHIGCIIHPDILPDGMASMGVTIHSHGRDRMVAMNRQDKRLAGIAPEDELRYQVMGQDLYHFSPTDYQGGPGYLATPDGVIFQNGNPPNPAIAAK